MREDIQEKINMEKAKMGDVIKDFQASDAPQFKGKSKEKRREMAIAAKLESDRSAKNEERIVEERLKQLLETKARIEQQINRMRFMGENVNQKSHPYLIKNYHDVLQQIEEAKKAKAKDEPCWDNYEMVGMKEKNGKTVPNCVPVKEEVEQVDEISSDTARSYLDKVRFKQAKRAVKANMGAPREKPLAAAALDKTAKSMELARKRVKEEVEQVDEESLRKSVAKTSGEFPERSSVKTKEGKKGTVVSAWKNYVKVAHGNKMKDYPTSELTKEEVEQVDEALIHKSFKTPQESLSAVRDMHKSLTKQGYTTVNKDHLNNHRKDFTNVEYRHPNKPSKIMMITHLNGPPSMTNHNISLRTADAKKSNLPEEVEQVDEAGFASTMKKAIAAHERGDAKRLKYHLNNAKTARYAMKSTEISKNKDLLDKYEDLRNLNKESVEQDVSRIDEVTYAKKKELEAEWRQEQRVKGRNNSNSRQLYYHKVDYKDKDKAKAEGMRYAPDVKVWYHTDKTKSANSQFPLHPFSKGF